MLKRNGLSQFSITISDGGPESSIITKKSKYLAQIGINQLSSHCFNFFYFFFFISEYCDVLPPISSYFVNLFSGSSLSNKHILYVSQLGIHRTKALWLRKAHFAAILLWKLISSLSLIFFSLYKFILTKN